MLILKNRYPLQSDDTDPTGYPHGKARNASTPNDGTGTPMEKDLINDLLGFQQALVVTAGITPSGNPDKADASDLLDALEALFYRRGLVDALLAARVKAGSARYVNGGSTTDNPVHWTENFAGAGFSVVGDAQVQVPEAGQYLVAWSGRVGSDHNNAAVDVGLTLKVGGSDAGFAQAHRFSTNPSDTLRVNGATLVDIADPAAQRITVALATSQGTPSLSGVNVAQLSITRVSP